MKMAAPRERQKRVFQPRVHPMERYDENRFIKRYRLRKESVRRLAEEYGDSRFCSTRFSGRGGGISAEDRMCLALRYFATGGIYSTLADFQGLDKSTICRCVGEISDFLYTRQQQHIKFPMSWEERYSTARDFYEKYGNHPYVIGAIDGTHIPIITPSRNEKSYVNRKQYHSINTMIVADANGIITHVDPRFPGSVADAYIVRNSALWDHGENGSLGNYFLLGDSGYPLQPFLFTPILRPRTPEEEAYNVWHKGTRVIVESTLGVLKQRFRCIDDSGGFLYHKPERAAKIIVACCCLHNIAVRTRMPPAPPYEEDEEDAVLPERNALGQPPQEVAEGQNALRRGQVQVTRRAEYIANQFVNLQ